MSSLPHGANISKAEVTHISANGFWLLAGSTEHFLAFSDFPWFKEASVAKILSVEESTPGHFYWPELDIDLGVETIEHPDRFPLSAKVNA